MKVMKEKTGLFRANPTVPFNPIQQLPLIEFDLRYFTRTLIFENHDRVTGATPVRLFTRMHPKGSTIDFERLVFQY